jgi:hypothetical protein
MRLRQRKATLLIQDPAGAQVFKLGKDFAKTYFEGTNENALSNFYWFIDDGFLFGCSDSANTQCNATQIDQDLQPQRRCNGAFRSLRC